jgi:hypothetical protein
VTATRVRRVVDGRFRSNSAYEIVLYDRLSAEQRASLPGLADAPSLFGVLLPRAAGLGVKSVSRDAALLFYAMGEPGTLPAFAHDMLGERCNETIARLVLDGMLEIEADGHFVSGAAAQDAVLEPVEAQPDGALARLSVAALRHTESLGGLDVRALARRLYGYGRIPLSPRWSRALGTPDALARHLDRSAGGVARRWLRSAWEVPEGDADPEWRHFRSRYATDDQSLGHKLYLSPDPEHLGTAFEAFVAVLSERRAPWFKVGRRPAGVLRPDKMVAYFSSSEAVRAAAEDLADRLAGMPAHGVAFTAELGGDGLVSWGMDPPELKQVLVWQRQSSWRLWVCERLATALVAAREDESEVEPWRFALRRLELAGVDPATFAPGPAIWGAEHGDN